MPEYSVAIRTLGLNPELLRRELETIYAQTIRPSRVVIYIAEGYAQPDFRVADEQYVSTPKGMVRQRAVAYDEIDTELILLLDDDVTLAPDTVEKLKKGLEDNNLDCISADVFCNHRMSLPAKVYAALSNLTFPHYSQRYAFKIHSNGSFSYLARPKRDVYLSQSAAGPCSLWRKSTLLRTRFADELWLDDLGFAYNDDGLESYKLHANGGRLGVHFASGATHVGGKTASSVYHRSAEAFAHRAKAVYLVWHRSLCKPESSSVRRIAKQISFWAKALWMLPVHCIAAVSNRNIRIPMHYINGTIDGIRYTHTDTYRNLPPYITKS